MFLSAYNVEMRHDFLWNSSIGYLEKEAESIDVIRKLVRGSIIYLVFGSMLQGFSFYLYNKKFHPFKEILNNQSKY